MTPTYLCPACRTLLEVRADAGGYAPPGFEDTPPDEHLWCNVCAEVYEIGEVPPQPTGESNV